MDVRTQRALEPHEQISLRDIVELLWSWRLPVLALVGILSVGAAVWSTALPKIYKASVVISPVTDAPSGGHMSAISSAMSEFSSGIASIAGLSPSSETQRRAEILTVLESESLTERYIRDNDLLPILYPKRWDAQQRRWNVSDPKQIPTLWRANRLFKGSVRAVTTDSRSGVVTLSIYWTDPHTAAKWANGLVQQANDYLRAKALDESDRNIAYLNSQAGRTDMVGLKLAIYALMESEIDKEMIARGSNEYALKVLDPAVAPESAYSPQRTLWVLVAFFTGVLLAALAAFTRLAWAASA
jgi:uncharacterized protein involved in exopolysaccharide biosynthesis